MNLRKQQLSTKKKCNYLNQLQIGNFILSNPNVERHIVRTINDTL